jgi:hypothetical protein
MYEIKNKTNTIISYSNIDWTNSYNRKSTTGYCTLVGGDLVTWKMSQYEFAEIRRFKPHRFAEIRRFKPYKIF